MRHPRFLLYFIIILFAPLPSTAEVQNNITVNEALKLALVNDFDLNQAWYAVDRDDWARWVVKADWFPEVFVRASDTRTGGLQSATNTIDGNLEALNATAELNQLIFSYSLLMDISAANWEYKGTFFAFLEEQVRVARDIRVAHYNYLLQKVLLEIQQQNLDLLQEAYENEDIKLEHGESSVFESNRNKLEYTNDLATYYLIQRNIELAHNEWVRLMGIDPSVGDTFGIAEEEVPIDSIPFLREILKRMEGDSGQLLRPLFSEDEIGSWKMIAMKVRPLIKQLYAQSEASRRRVRSIKGEYVPTLNLNSRYSHIKTHGPATLNPHLNPWSVRVELRWTIFDGFSREWRMKSERANHQIDVSLENQARDRVQLDIENESATVQQAVYTYLSALESQQLAIQGLEYAKERFSLGAISALEYRDMIQSKTRAAFNLARATVGMVISYYDLLAAIGVPDDVTVSLLSDERCK